MPTIENKEAVLFWLRRHAKEVAARAQPPSQEMMAERGMPYTERSRAVQAALQQADGSAVELKSLEEAIKYIEENG